VQPRSSVTPPPTTPRRNQHSPQKDRSGFETNDVQHLLEALTKSVTVLASSVQQMKKEQAAVKKFVAAAHERDSTARDTDSDAGSPRKNSAPKLKIRPGPDIEAKDGSLTCGRCHIYGHGRDECPRQRYKCRLCSRQGHASVECDQHRPRWNRDKDRQGSRSREGGE